jgi:prephenate dehydrogenase
VALPLNKIALVGVGLLGGSLALAIRERKLAHSVTGYVRRAASIAECAEAGLKDFATQDLLAAVRDADVVILCTPLAQMRELVAKMAPALKRGSIVTDVGSVKGSVATELQTIVADAGAQFIGGHPMAGGEKMGVGAARADLFRNAICVLTPGAGAATAGIQLLEEFWHAVGARVMLTSPELHDELVARCSHLPHVLAAQLATFILDPALGKEQPMLCANGFRDTTRIASGSPEMWRDIAMANRQNLSATIGAFIAELEKIRSRIEAGDADAVEKFFVAAKQRRDGWCAQGSSPSPE